MPKHASIWESIRDTNGSKVETVMREMLLYESLYVNDDQTFLIQPLSHADWDKVSSMLNVDKRWLYVQFVEDRRGVLKLLKDTWNLANQPSSTTEPTNETEYSTNEVQEEAEDLTQANATKDSDDCSSYGDGDVGRRRRARVKDTWTKSVTLKLTNEEWAEMQPELSSTDTAGKRQRLSLRPKSWTHVVANKLALEEKSACVWVFKTNYVKKDGSCNFHAACKDCNRQLVGEMECNDIENGVTLKYINITFDGPQGKHTGIYKRQLSGRRREKFLNCVTDRSSAMVAQHEMAASQMDWDDAEPPTIPSCVVLRKAISEKRLKRRFSSDVHESILQLMYNIPNYIREIGIEKFFVHFWTKEQEELYREKASTACLHIDATGSIVNRSLNCDDTKSHVFFYVCTMEGLPVTEMLSTRHHVPAISYWLMSWLRSVQKLPARIVTDQGLALIMAACLTFNGMSLATYIHVCYLMTTNCNVNSAMQPKVMLRIDCAHLVKVIASIPCLRYVGKMVKKFYMHAACLMLMQSTLVNVRQVFHHICIASMGETYTSVVTTSVDCLRKLIEKADVNVDSEDNDGYVTVDDSNEMNTKFSNPFVEFGADVISDCQLIITRMRKDRLPNPFNIPKLASSLLDAVFSMLPLGSAIMTPFFVDSPLRESNGEVESFNKYLKRQLLIDFKLPLSADVFLQVFFKDLEGHLKLKKARQEMLVQEMKDLDSEGNFTSTNIATDDNFTCVSAMDECNDHELDCASQPMDNSSTQLPVHTSVGGDVINRQSGSTIRLCCVCNSEVGTAHTCINCKKSVHVICGIPVGEECYTQKVNCFVCVGKQSPNALVPHYPEQLRATENWDKSSKGRSSNSMGNTIKKPTYYDPNSDWSEESGMLKVIRNANLMASLRIKENKIILKNTCGFDAIAHIFGSTYADCKRCLDMSMQLYGEENSFLKFMNIYRNCKNMQSTYRERAILLTSSFPNEKCQHLTYKNTFKYDFYLAVHVIAQGVINMPIVFRRVCANQYCPSMIEELKQQLIYIRLRDDNDLPTILTQVLDYLAIKNTYFCGRAFKPNEIESRQIPRSAYSSDRSISLVDDVCNGRTEITLLSLPPILVLNVSQGRTDGDTDPPTLKLAKLPKKLLINDVNYYLRGCIHEKHAHFTSYNFRSDGRTQCYDDLHGVRGVKAHQTFCCRLIIYSI